MDRFGETQSLVAYEHFTDCVRSISSLMAIFYLIKYFKFNSILEIGFWQGQTFGLMVEAAKSNTKLLTLDPVFQFHVYDRFYKKPEFTNNKEISFIETTFENFNSAEKFDFILVDSGMPDKEWISDAWAGKFDDNANMILDVNREQHLFESLKYANANTIIMLDDYKRLDSIATNFVNLQNDFVPFLSDGQSLYFHKKNHSCVEFLDEYLESKISALYTLYNKDYKGYTIKTIEQKKVINIDEIKLLQNLLQFFKI